MAAARLHFGARIEIGPALDDDAGAGTAVFVAAGENRIAAGVGPHAALARLGVGRDSQQNQGAKRGKCGGNEFQAHKKDLDRAVHDGQAV